MRTWTVMPCSCCTALRRPSGTRWTFAWSPTQRTASPRDPCPALRRSARAGADGQEQRAGPAARLLRAALTDWPRRLLHPLQHRQAGLRLGPSGSGAKILRGAGGGELFRNRGTHKVVERELLGVGHLLCCLPQDVREFEVIRV